MTDATAQFFDELAARGRDPLLANVIGVVRFDVTEDGATRQWCVRIDRGDLMVASGAECADADCVVAAAREVFDGVARGEVNVMAGLLRGDVLVTGDVELMVAAQRLFPGPPPSGELATVDGTKGRQA